MMEARLGDGAPAVLRTLECNGDVEATPGRYVLARHDDPRARLARRDVYDTFVGMRRQVLDDAGHRMPVAHDGVNVPDGPDALKVAVGARPMIRPDDIGRRRVVGAAIVALRVVGVEMMRGADTFQIADGATQSHVARDQKATTQLPETAYAGAIGGRQAVAPIHREQPQLIELQFRQLRKYRVRRVGKECRLGCS